MGSERLSHGRTPHHAGRTEDSIRVREGLFGGKLTGEGIGLDILGAGAVRDGEVEPAEE